MNAEIIPSEYGSHFKYVNGDLTVCFKALNADFAFLHDDLEVLKKDLYWVYKKMLLHSKAKEYERYCYASPHFIGCYIIRDNVFKNAIQNIYYEYYLGLNRTIYFNIVLNGTPFPLNIKNFIKILNKLSNEST